MILKNHLDKTISRVFTIDTQHVAFWTVVWFFLASIRPIKRTLFGIIVAALIYCATNWLLIGFSLCEAPITFLWPVRTEFSVRLPLRPHRLAKKSQKGAFTTPFFNYFLDLTQIRLNQSSSCCALTVRAPLPPPAMRMLFSISKYRFYVPTK